MPHGDLAATPVSVWRGPHGPIILCCWLAGTAGLAFLRWAARDRVPSPAVVKRYRAHQVTLNIETKVEAGAPEQTAPREVFVRRVFQEIRASGLERQVTIQSFDWGALRQMHRLAPRWPLVALTNYDFLQVGQPGASPWLGGIDADDYDGDLVRAADAIPGVTTVSPNYGFPQNGTIADPGYPNRIRTIMAERGMPLPRSYQPR